MRRYLYLSTAVAGVMMMSGNASAQCVTSQDCTTLGYTQTSCPDGKGLKCPFGNKWACFSAEITPAQCTELGFTYSCTGTGYSGGVSKACNGKYYACVCASGYEWKDGSCQKQVLNGAQGDLYYCNGKVVGVKTGDMNFYVAMENLGYMSWSAANSKCQSYSFCANVKSTLPTKEQLLSIYRNKARINTLLLTNGGTKMTDDYYWSSTYDEYYFYEFVSISNGKWGSSDYNGLGRYVRLVLASW